MESLLCVVLGFVPGIFWLWFLHGKDDYEPEPWHLVLPVFVLGGLSTMAVLLIRPWFDDLLPLGAGIDRTLADAFLLTAPLEEILKMIALLVGIGWSREVDEPLDGIIYGAAVGLGFASVENVFYVFGVIDGGPGQAAYVAGMRGMTATLVHVSTSGVLGFFLGLTKFRGPRRRWPLIATGLILAIGFHGAYNAFLEGGEGWWVSLLLVLPGMLYVLSTKIHWARARSEAFHDAPGSDSES